MKALIVVAALLALLATASPAGAAPLTRTAAIDAAQDDAKAGAGELGSETQYPFLPPCKRISKGRFDCPVWGAGRTFEIGLYPNPSYYSYEKCTWTAVVKGLRFYPYLTTRRRDRHCQAWTSESPLDWSGSL